MDDSTSSIAATMQQATSMASMAQELKGLASTMQRYDQNFQELGRIKDAVTRMEVLMEGTKSTNARQFERIEKIEAEMEKVSGVLMQMSNVLASKADTDRVDLIDRSTSGFMNRVKGGIAVAGVVWIAVQGGIGWALIRFVDTTAANSMAIGLDHQQLETLDREMAAMKVLKGQ